MPAEPLTAEQEATFARYYPDDIKRLSCKLYYHLWRQYADPEDALAQAAIGLLVAVRRFKPEMGTKFSTLLCLCLRSALTDGLAKGASRETIRNKSLKSDKRFEGVKCGQMSAYETHGGPMSRDTGKDRIFDIATPVTDDATRNASEAREVVTKIMARLPWKDQEVLYDRFVRGWSCAVIAWHRQRRRTTVKMHISRVLKQAAAIVEA
jgi:RNA polymerase sigma factor (sigma-70 family)